MRTLTSTFDTMVQFVEQITEKNKLLTEIREWFANEVAAGDEDLQVWVDRIDATFVKDGVTDGDE